MHDIRRRCRGLPNDHRNPARHPRSRAGHSQPQARSQYPKKSEDASELAVKKLPEYIEAHEVNALLRAAPNPRARLLMMVEWRAGLRVSEALALEVGDLSLEVELPTLRVRQGKGRKARIVPVHPELHSALISALQFGNIGQEERIVKASRSTADRWIREATAAAQRDERLRPVERFPTTPCGTATPGIFLRAASLSTTSRAAWVTARSRRR